MILLGLTGSIGMGKSTTARLFADEGVPVYDADEAVHALYAPGGAAAEPIGAAFAGVVEGGRVNREALSARVLHDGEALKRLEGIVHPLARAAQARFLAESEARGAQIAVMDVPLLFETGGDRLVDAVIVVTAPASVQRDRVLARPGMTPIKLEQILARQLPDSEKRARADFVINTGFGLEDARRQVRAVLATIANAA